MEEAKKAWERSMKAEERVVLKAAMEKENLLLSIQLTEPF